jgi:hypothetical protein
MAQVEYEQGQAAHGVCAVIVPEAEGLEEQALLPRADRRPIIEERLAGIRRRYRSLQEWVDGFALELATLEERSANLSSDGHPPVGERLAELRRRYQQLCELVANVRVQLGD